ncbi:MAG: YitT family protein [Selenomonadales bacterium]|nr:YitT family protein [Selenomonadales bacterium]
MVSHLKQYGAISFGILLGAVGLNMFLIPNRIAAGGLSGLATILHYMAGWPVGVVMLVVNIPLLLYGLYLFGRGYTMRTIYGAVLYSVLVDLTAPYLPVMTEDILLASLYGGILAGIGAGIVFRFRCNTAGTAMVAAILQHKWGISVGQALLLADGIVVFLAGIVFQSAELALYAAISIFVTSKVVDIIQEGRLASKAFLIVTDHAEVLTAEVNRRLVRSVTVIGARGGYSGHPKEVLLCVVTTEEVSPLKELIHEHDPSAFVIVSDAYEVLGKGFADIR